MIITIDTEIAKDENQESNINPPKKKNFVLGCIVNESYKHRFFTNPDKMWNYIIEIGKKCNEQGKILYVYSANMKYDFYAFADWNNPLVRTLGTGIFIKTIYEDDVTFEKRSQNMYKYGKKVPQYKRNYIYFMDLFSLYRRFNLKKIGDLIDLPKLESPMELFDKTKKELTQKEIWSMQPYCLRDTQIVMKAIDFLKHKLKEDGLNIKYLFSISQIGMNYCMKLLRESKEGQNLFCDKFKTEFHKSKHNKQIVHQNKYKLKYSRGGFVEAFKLGKFDNCIKIDHNANWQYTLMNLKMPDLKNSMKVSKPLLHQSEYEILSTIGYSKVCIQVPDIYIPFLSVRIDNTSYRPKHKSIIIGTYTNQELLYATRLGYKILDIEYSVLYMKNPNPFKNIVRYFYNKRKNANNKFDDWFYKQIANSYLGKFGYSYANYDIKAVNINQIQQFEKQGYIKIDEHERTFLMQKLLGFTQKKYYAPEIYAFATADSRIYMHKAYSKFDSKQLVYTDTDSIIIKDVSFDEINKKFDIGVDIGQWKLECEKHEPSIVYAKKYYSFGEDVHTSGIYKVPLDDFKQGVGVNERQGNEYFDTADEFIKYEVDFVKSQDKYLQFLKTNSRRNIYIDEYENNIEYFNKILKSIEDGNKI